MQGDINWFESRARLTPTETAVIEAKTDQSWSYQQLRERADKLAQYFKGNGIQKGDRVAILASNHISYFDFFFACMKTGAIFVPLNWRLAEAELTYILGDAAPELIGVEPQYLEKLPSRKTEAEVLLIPDSNYLDLLSTEPGTFHLELKESDALAMIYTGGTTGRPKGVVLSHRSILWNAINTVITWSLSKEDTTLTCMPMFHTGGLNVYCLPLLLVGGKIVLASEFDPNQAVEDLLKYRCTVVLFVPTMYHMIIQNEAFQQSSFPYMKVFVSGGAPCPHPIYEAFAKKGLAFKEGYGLTEAGPNNFYIESKDVMQKPGSVGKPMLFNDIRIVTNHGVQAVADEVGELLLRGHHSFEYYWNKPDQTADTIRDDWIHTGDLARSDAEGFVYIVGRKKDMIITGGENVYPLEVENWLETHEAVDEVAVMGLEDDKWGEVVTAFVVLKTELDVAELEGYCNQKLTRYKVPKQFYHVDELPKTPVGKIDKAKLKEEAAK